MLHQGQEKSRVANLSRWKSERNALLWGRRPSVVGSTFEEDLALFGRQVREETGEEIGRPEVRPTPRRRPPEWIPVP